MSVWYQEFVLWWKYECCPALSGQSSSFIKKYSVEVINQTVIEFN